MSAVSLSPAERSLLEARDEASFAEVLAVFTGAGVPGRGTPAIAGSYTLDASGLHFRPLFPFLPLGRDFEWRIHATAADRQSPRADGLRGRPPEAEAAPLVVELPEPLDEALLHRLIWVEDAEGRAVAGTAAVSEGETRWSFFAIEKGGR